MKPLKAASSNSDAMSNFQNPLSEGQQVVPLPGAEQTTSLLVVLIIALFICVQDEMCGDV